MLTIVSWKWTKTGTWSTNYHACHVNALQRMVAKHLHIPHRFVCITDDPHGIECETIPLWNVPDVKVLPNKPNCYKRLYTFSKEMESILGSRFVSMDLDCLILPGPDKKGLTPVLDRPDDFMIVNGFRNNRGCCPYNGSMWMMDTGSREKVWIEFDPELSPKLAASNALPNGNKYFGSDQSWIAHCLPGEKTWGPEDGVMSFVRDVKPRVPASCRILFFAGHMKPWSNALKRLHPDIANEYSKYLN